MIRLVMLNMSKVHFILQIVGLSLANCETLTQMSCLPFYAVACVIVVEHEIFLLSFNLLNVHVLLEILYFMTILQLISYVKTAEVQFVSMYD